MAINDAMTALCDDLAAGDVPNPLTQEFTLANVWYDLCVLAGEEPPAAVLTAVDGETAALVPGLDAFARRLLAATPEAFAGSVGHPKLTTAPGD